MCTLKTHINREINERMSKRFGWLLGVVVLVTIGLLVACSSNYNASSDGLVLVGSQGSGLIETFGFNLFNGHLSEISNTPNDTSSEVCVLNGFPGSLVVDPKGVYAYTIINANTSCDTSTAKSTTGILAFKVNSDGSTTQVGSQVPFIAESVFILGTANKVSPPPPVVPGSMVMDPAGKFLFVADRATTAPDPSQPPGSPNPNLYVPGAVSVFAIGSGGSVTEVAGSPFFTAGTANNPTTVSQASLDIVSVAPTPTVFPAIGVNGVQNSVCSTLTPPTTQYLYAVDGLGNQVFEFQVNTSSGVLTNPPNHTQILSFPTDQIPAGVAVDPCNRFVYVSDSLTNKVSAYTMCNGYSTQSSTCPQSPLLPDGSLVQVSGSPFSLTGSSNEPGPILVDPYGNNVYVLGLLSDTISPLGISPVSGRLTALSPATVATGLQPMSMAIRGDDNWLFVTNYNAATMSQYSITPATGQLTVQPVVQTDNYPWGVAVK
jgi:Lactonase, 7-bladed beta-propeller